MKEEIKFRAHLVQMTFTTPSLLSESNLLFFPPNGFSIQAEMLMRNG